ncbi:MAG: myb/SANT-like DNA-binding domain-containing protein [Clostridiales bacterium]|nr:myb/SANT-like DNA-binding domain-containing protein [Clostridiales bacterium]
MPGNDWRHDPRIAQLDPVKLDCLTTLAARVQRLPKSELAAALMEAQEEAAKRNIQFSDAETELLIDIISTRMTPVERKRLQLMHSIARKMAARGS